MEHRRLDLHGGNIYKAEREYGIQRGDILDFSANINPLGVPQSVKKVIASNLDNLVNYPDPECTELKAGISQYLAVPEDNIIVGNGASEIIYLLFDVMRPKKVLIPAPTFAEYASAAGHFGAEVEYFELKEADSFKLDTGILLKRIDEEGVDAVFLCNPNNPTSKLVPAEEMLEIVKRAQKKGTRVIIDETFIELTLDGNSNSMADRLQSYGNLFVIRALTKLFAIPGLRIGYGMGDKNIIEKMWDKKLPWSVNSFACCLGRIFLDEKDYLERTSLWLAQELPRFYQELLKIGKLKVFEPQTNFILAKISDGYLTAPILVKKMMEKGILIRDASNFKFLNEKFFRIAVKDRESNARFLEALKERLKG